MEFDMELFDPLNANEDMWELFFDYDASLHNLLSPNDPRESKEKRKRALILQAKSSEMNFQFYGLFEKDKRDKMIGMYDVGSFGKDSAFYEENKAILIAEIVLLPEYRQKGIFKSLLKNIHQKMIDSDKAVVIGNSQEEIGRMVAGKIGANIVQETIENRVNLKDIDWNIMDDWIAKGEERNPKTKLEFFEEVPDSIMDNFLVTFNATMNQVPRDDSAINNMTATKMTVKKEEEKRRELGNKQILALTIEEDGEISSLSNLLYSPTKKQSMSVGLTGTLEKNRGRGLGKWIKAAIIKKVKEDYEGLEYIKTGNSTTNAPMLSINDRMGFKQHKIHLTMQMMRSDIENYLKTNN